ncbi:MAG: DUF975 family protein [Clostridia bacterium]|nr:DUF975 family protein [Clostridia bacterium]
MFAKDYRALAWSSLKGKRGTLALITLIYSLIMGVCTALSRVYIGGIISLLITGAFTLGIASISNRVARYESVEVEMLFSGFKRFGSSLALYLINTIFIALWSLLLIIPGIIKSLSYGLSFYILSDNQNISTNEARKLSMQMMEGHKWKLFCLHFSFIGWYLLGILTLGILYFWIVPYHNTAVAVFYQDLLPKENVEETRVD